MFFINTTQKTLKPSQKRFQFSGWVRKTSYPGISAEEYQQKHEIQVASKKVYWKNYRVFQTNVAIWQVFGTLCYFSSRPFLKQIASHVSANTFQLKFLGMKFFLIHPENWNIFWKVLKFFMQC